MQERAALVNGTLEIESSPGQGTTVYLRLPSSSAAAAVLSVSATHDPDEPNEPNGPRG
jgi:chemotaxis protein histidine kinase CheA